MVQSFSSLSEAFQSFILAAFDGSTTRGAAFFGGFLRFEPSPTGKDKSAGCGKVERFILDVF